MAETISSHLLIGKASAAADHDKARVALHIFDGGGEHEHGEAPLSRGSAGGLS